ncbi:uncharacterized protein LOC131000876 [Salvia miltiorrhiza]|uniref:uncharacterized protein LOC131000876 n=1 Tax=Salvia miltiorrhiza TaxID=226208 RepID=UPI0025AD28B5|nr:uncharacterized protein LOC131000876 [Salvia miltiorrhiza]XP_057782992.1 uncharacterized protein LOC131000876 [Salvia miltiorrhiza]XP_057782993.1 uncharacterized protein LOC131000876 [Salvia miltiorrhiza]
MVASHHFTRIDTLELKELIYEKIGHQRGETYFNHLKRFLSSKLSKDDFDKSCIETIGRENLSIHNRLIRSIIQNACRAKTPPQKARKVEALGVKVAHGHPRNHLQSLYGDAFPHSPRKCRSPISRDRKFRDRPSPLGPLGKSPSLTCEETVSRIQEQQSAAELQTVSGRPPTGAASVEDGEEVEQCAVIPVSQRWSSITAPLGVSVDLGGARKAPHHSGLSCQTSGELPDTRSLGRRLQKKLASEGVGISLDGANLLNNGLDVYLKKMISKCIGVAGSRCVDPLAMVRQSNGERTMQPSNASMLDFRVAMESNPSILGEDWSTQLEKVCNYALR